MYVLSDGRGGDLPLRLPREIESLRMRKPSGMILASSPVGKSAVPVCLASGICCAPEASVGSGTIPCSTCSNFSGTLPDRTWGGSAGCVEVIQVLSKPVDNEGIEHDNHYRQHRRRRDVKEPPYEGHGGKDEPHDPSKLPAAEDAGPPEQRDKADDQVDDAPDDEDLVEQHGIEAA